MHLHHLKIDQSNIIPKSLENLKLTNISNLSKENKNILIRGRIQFIER